MLHVTWRTAPNCEELVAIHDIIAAFLNLHPNGKLSHLLIKKSLKIIHAKKQCFQVPVTIDGAADTISRCLRALFAKLRDLKMTPKKYNVTMRAANPAQKACLDQLLNDLALGPASSMSAMSSLPGFLETRVALVSAARSPHPAGGPAFGMSDLIRAPKLDFDGIESMCGDLDDAAPDAPIALP